MTIVTTAINGEMLRDYAARRGDDDVGDVAIFPEAGMSPIEQRQFMAENAGRYKEIITFSAYIISDTPGHSLIFLDADTGNHKLGDSVNRVQFRWHPTTIGDIALAKIESIRDKLSEAGVDKDALTDEAYALGDSVERVLLLTAILNADSVPTPPADESSSQPKP